MERIEDLLASGCYVGYKGYSIPGLPVPMYGLKWRLIDVWLVLTGRAVAVQWPHHRDRRTRLTRHADQHYPKHRLIAPDRIKAGS